MAHARQLNGHDCGVFTLMFISQLGVSAPLHFVSQGNMHQLRMHIALALINEKYPAVVLETAADNDAAKPPEGKSSRCCWSYAETSSVSIYRVHVRVTCAWYRLSW